MLIFIFTFFWNVDCFRSSAALFTFSFLDLRVLNRVGKISFALTPEHQDGGFQLRREVLVHIEDQLLVIILEGGGLRCQFLRYFRNNKNTSFETFCKKCYI